MQSNARQELATPQKKASTVGLCSRMQPTYEECVAILVQHYIPKDEIPFLSHVEPSKSRICGGWVQALPHVSRSDADFEQIVSPAVRALTMSMMVAGTSRRQEYLNTYGDALQGIRSILDSTKDEAGSTVAIASMCLALSEVCRRTTTQLDNGNANVIQVLVPTSNDGYQSHLRGVAAMMQTRGPNAFTDGVAHLMFVGVRPLIVSNRFCQHLCHIYSDPQVLDAILRRKSTFLIEERWRTIPFSVHPASHMQILLGNATTIASLLEAVEKRQSDPETIRIGFLEVVSMLQAWEDSFIGEGTVYHPVVPSQLDLSTDPQHLPNPCFDFVDVSHANSLTHCWAFRIVCFLYISTLESQRREKQEVTNSLNMEQDHHAKILNLCTLICQGLPYLVQKEMSLYGSMSAGFPLHMVSESLQTMRLQDCNLTGWCTAIKGQMRGQRIVLYEEMAESAAFT